VTRRSTLYYCSVNEGLDTQASARPITNLLGQRGQYLNANTLQRKLERSTMLSRIAFSFTRSLRMNEMGSHQGDQRMVTARPERQSFSMTVNTERETIHLPNIPCSPSIVNKRASIAQRRSIFGRRPSQQSTSQVDCKHGGSCLLAQPAVNTVKGKHFVPIEKVSSLSSDLPTLPSPLRRFYRTNGSQKALSGIYPLVSPVSILRTKSLKADTDDFDDTHSTASAHTACTEASSAPSSPSIRDKHVCFDPRITVSEFPDDIQARKWYCDEELDRFRSETLDVVQRYLCRHPELVLKYSHPFHDPIIGKPRKRAIFSLTSTCLNEDDKRIEMERILVVDRHKTICDLFDRSLQLLFPHAVITTKTTSDEALQFFRSNDGHVDLIVAEERLNHPVPSFTSWADVGKSGSLPGRLAGVRLQPQLRRSLSSSDTRGVSTMSGSQLYKKICDECHLKAMNRPVLVGVSTHPQAEEKIFKESGADMLWGKPPPTMDSTLASKLMTLLIEKRRGS